MTTLDHTALMRAILESPADDLPRLALADHLEESGQDERAEFIRLQCRLAVIDHEIVQRGYFHGLLLERDDLRRRERELLDSHGYGWCDGVAGEDWKVDGGVKGQGKVSVRFFKGIEQADAMLSFRRGFVAHISLPLDAFVRHAEALFLAQPIESVTLTDREPYHHTTFFGWPVDLDLKDYPYASSFAALVIPRGIWNLLAAYNRRFSTSTWRWYDTPEAAHADLSAACVRCGRELRDEAWKEGRG